MDNISIDKFAEVEMRVGEVKEATGVEGSEKMLRLKVDFGEEELRTVFTGVRRWYDPEYFVGKRLVFVTNLEYRAMFGEESQAMILGLDGKDKVVFWEVGDEVEVGKRVK